MFVNVYEFQKNEVFITNGDLGAAYTLQTCLL